MRAQALVEADAFGDLHDVGPRRLAHVRDLVDERDARHQERVRRELDHLRRRDVSVHDRRLDPRVERLDDRAVRIVERTDHHSIRVHEVTDGVTFRKELRIRGIADVREPTRLERRAHLVPGPDGDGGLHREDLPPLDPREILERGPHERQVGVAGVGRRCLDADEDDVGGGELVRIERVADAIAVALEHLG